MGDDEATERAKAALAWLYPEGYHDPDLDAVVAFAIREAVAAERSRWSKVPPAAPGWYWYRESGAVEVVRVEQVGERSERPVLTCEDGRGMRWLPSMTGDWCGPLEVPGDA